VKVFVDTSALMALLDEDDVHHREASATLRSLVDTVELVTHNYVHLEAIALARRRLGAAAAARLIDALLPIMTTRWVDEALHTTAVVAHRAASGPSVTDYVSFGIMRLEGIDIAFAFDHDFETAGFRRPHIAHAQGQRSRLSEASDLVSVSEIAARAGRSVNTIQSWRRRHHDFPTPVAALAAGPIWVWPGVERWIAAHARGQR
jgi:predicted nucleic acid-binding protein